MDELQSLMNAIKNLAEIDEDSLNDAVMKEILDSVNAQFNTIIVAQSISQIVQNFEDQGLTKAEAAEAIKALTETLNEIIYGEVAFSGNKKILVDTVLQKMYDIFNAALDKYHSYSINLPIKLEEGAHIPTYAHDTDAAADLYAMEDITIPPHFLSVPVKTGVHIQLPEGWVAMVLPRSSIGAKTSLRLSNSSGVIDSGYRGEVRALYDNIGDEPYEIHKGDRIAQMYIMPSYRFKAKVVDSLEESDRGEAGFGSTGA